MTQHVKAKVEAVKKGPVVTTKKDGSQCKPWYKLFLKIDNHAYVLGYANDNFGPHVNVGDEVEFDFIEKNITDEMGESKVIREIKNEFDEKDETKKFRNLTNPAKPSNGNGFKGGGFKKDPEEQARITAMASMNSAVAHLSGSNAPDATLFALAEKIENWVFAVVQRRKFTNFQENKPNVNVDDNKFVEDAIPF